MEHESKETKGFVKTRLEVGDVIKIHNPLMKEEYSKYPVLSIDGNRAKTDFRTFNTKIYPGNKVYEFGKRQSAIYNNVYKYLEDQ